MKAIFNPTVVLLYLCITSLTFQSAKAQSICRADIEQVLTTVGERCSDFARNQACYVNAAVQADLSDGIPSDVFDAPEDITSINNILALQPTDEATGVVVMKVQANLPQTIPGQNVILVLLGNIALDAVRTEATYPAEPITVTTTVGVNLREGPSTSDAIIESVPSNTPLQVDGTDDTGEWLRVLQLERSVWVFRNHLKIRK